MRLPMAPALDYAQDPNDPMLSGPDIPNMYTGPFPVTYGSMNVGFIFPPSKDDLEFTCSGCGIPSRINSDFKKPGTGVNGGSFYNHNKRL